METILSHRAYKEMISSHTESTPDKFSGLHSRQYNINSFYMNIHAEHTRKRFHPPWAYEEMI